MKTFPAISGSFDNHDSRIRYCPLALERSLEDLPERELPEGYTFISYAPGDRDAWIAIEKSAREFDTREEGLEAWQRYYAAREDILPGRMFFIVNAAGEKCATATAFFDIAAEDDHENAMLHWVAVRREDQGRGLSKPLILRVLHRMKELGYRRVTLHTQTTTWLACRVYLDLGFRPIACRAETDGVGWRIIKALTGHIALKELAPAAPREILKEEYL